MATDTINPNEFLRLREKVTHPSLKSICRDAYNLAVNTRYFRENLDVLDASDLVTLMNMKSLLESIQYTQWNIVNQEKLTITEEVKEKMQEEFQNMFLMSSGQGKSTDNALTTFKKKLRAHDYSEVAATIANIDSYLRSYIHEPLVETITSMQKESIRTFAENTANRAGLVPMYTKKGTTGVLGIKPASGGRST